MAAHPPDDVMEAVKFIRRLREKPYLSREEKIDLNRAKLRVAYWACRSEHIVATRETLGYILGGDSAEIMGHFDRYLEREKDQEKDGEKKKREGGTSFWDGA